jgi:AcrR family transcriptional regulator
MIHVMSLREDQVALTRRRIVDAVAEMLVEEDPAALSVPAVASRAGVSVRTVYRHFEDKAALVQAVAEIDDPARVLPLPAPNGSDLCSYLRRAWSDDVQLPHLRAQLQTPAGQQVRAERRRSQRPFIDLVLAAWSVEMDDDSARRLIDLLQLLTGNAALVELTEVLGEAIDEAAATATWAVEALLVHARRTGRVPGGGDSYPLDPSSQEGA